jgi:hypothetical protein
MSFGFNIYLLFIISWFLHLSSRITALGAVRFDLILVFVLFIIIINSNKDVLASEAIKSSDTNKILKLLIFYIAFSLPFVQWPGSALHNVENFIKVIVFYYFTIYFVTTKENLHKFVVVFIACQSLRIIEPVYLHVTQGYWGSIASMSGWEFMERLSGAPHDTINPNGLAFVVLTVIPFYYFFSSISLKYKIVAFMLIPLSIYALLLTGSRSGLIGLFVIFIGISLKSKNKLFVLLLICIGSIVSFNYLGANFKDRYTSIIESDTKNAATAEGRIEGIKSDLVVALRRPLFGYGLGTSREANANFKGVDQLSHNLYTEIAEELGFIGLIIFLLLIKSIINNYKANVINIKSKTVKNSYFIAINESMHVWLFMNILFSFASYGLSSYEWYLFAGISVALKHQLETMPD